VEGRTGHLKNAAFFAVGSITTGAGPLMNIDRATTARVSHIPGELLELRELAVPIVERLAVSVHGHEPLWGFFVGSMSTGERARRDRLLATPRSRYRSA
jgi:hypothetical protein